MFAAMADHFIRQLKIVRHFYLSQYSYIDRKAKKAMKKNMFGAIVDQYLRALNSGDMLLFETDSGKTMRKIIEDAVKIERVAMSGCQYYNVEIDRKKVNPEKNELDVSKAAVEHEKARKMIDIHNSDAVISLLIQFENFLTSYFEWLIKKYPEKYLTDKCIKYSDLIKYDFEDLKKELTAEAANGIMSQPLGEWLRLIRSHKFDLSIIAEYLDEFTEIYYRRNLIVHNRGKVNRQYLSSAGKQREEKPLGESLNTDKKYVLNAFCVSMIIVYGILYASLKANQEDKSEYLNFLFNSGFDHMMEEDWNISYFIFGILITDQGADKLTDVYSQINYWISCKNMGKFDAIKQEVMAADFSAMACSIRMAKEMLLENYERAVPLLDEALASELTPDMVEKWPIFIQFRKTEHYKRFCEKYADRLEKQSLNPNELENSKADAEAINDLKESFCKGEDELVEENAELVT